MTQQITSKTRPAAEVSGPVSESRPLNFAGETISIDPATLEEVGRVPNTDLSKMPEIMERARAAQKKWALLSFDERKAHILKMRDYIVEHAEELATIVSRDNGKLRLDALTTEVIPSALAADWYAKNAEK